jgi:hypothetical protein
MSLDTKFNYGGMCLTWRDVIIRDLRAFEERNSDPSRWSWTENIRFPPALFDHWLKGAMRAEPFPTHPKRRAGAKRTDRELLKEFIEATYPDGPPENLSYKDIANQAAQMLGKVVHPRTVARARAQLAEKRTCPFVSVFCRGVHLASS